MSTASYSNTSGTDAAIWNRSLRSNSGNRKDAPRGDRSAATRTLLSGTTRTQPSWYHM
ncbi:MAG TPA: hypothetical protein VEU62_18840 [Bryobacterales bacterium]|nr:hypothetical protein [Bryobacterales bacterium]